MHFLANSLPYLYFLLRKSSQFKEKQRVSIKAFKLSRVRRLLVLMMGQSKDE